MNKSAIWLQRLLIVIGMGLMVATIPVFFPVSLMATIHAWLGLGEFPDFPIVVYLARSTSLMYAVHGLVMFVTGLRIKELSTLVPVLGWGHVFIGFVIFGVDITSGMPWYWTAAEGIPISLAGGLILFLWSKSRLISSSGHA